VSRKICRILQRECLALPFPFTLQIPRQHILLCPLHPLRICPHQPFRRIRG